MNRKFKAISTVVLTAVMCVSFVGCANNEKREELNESNIESHIESIFGGNSDNLSSSTPDETSEPEVKFEMTDEIKNATLDSGLIQINNEVFQQGGYITVADLVEKYKDTYDFTYKDGTYEEHKDYLLEYKEPNNSFGSFDRKGELLGDILELTPKIGSNKELRSINVVIGNFTSPEEKITLDKGIVIGYNFAAGPVNSTGSSARTVHSVWLPQGIGLTGTLNKGKILREVPDDLKETNGNFVLGSFPEFLEQQGFSLSEKIPSSFSASKTEEYDKKYKTVTSTTACLAVYGVGEANLFGKKPVYEYTIFFDSDTDKMSETRIALIGFTD